MKNDRMKLFFAATMTAVFVVSLAGAAQAYGPEGMFGGRPRPDNTVALDEPLKPEDRPLRSQSVLQRPRPDYDPIPVTLGSFEIFPSVETGAYYDSNIYATEDDTESDAIIGLRPAVNAFSNWNRHAVSMTTFGDINFYTDKEDENYIDFVTNLQGRYDIMPQTWVAANAGYQHLAEPRSSPDAVSGSEPTTFNVADGGLSAYRGVGKIKVGGDYALRRYFYNDTPSSSGLIDQSRRDRTHHTLGSKVSYDLTENLKPYIRGSYNWRDYDNNRSHNSQGYETVVGATADFGGITSAEAYVGWMSQEYDNFTNDGDNDGLKFGGRLEWNVTGKTTVVLETNRTIEETTSTNFSSYKATGGSATVTHELLRNILLEGDFGFTRSDYVGLGERQDDTMFAGAGVRWLINRYLYSDLFYNWTNRDSDASGNDYSRHLVALRLGVQM